MRTDEQIKKDVVDALYGDASIDASDIKVTVSDGEVILEGYAPSFAARHAASWDVWGIEGVKEVHNHISVRFDPTFITPSDDEIRANAVNGLRWNTDIYSLDIDISVTGGTVILNGIVDAYWKRWKVENLISNLKGVVDVENHLTVVPGEGFADKDVAQSIEKALKRDTTIAAEDVTVRVENGNVNLTGSVPTYYARRRASTAAINTPGVVTFENHITVV